MADPDPALEKVEELEDVGLGRGINATDVTPWLNKSSFQVRHVKAENIIGTDEGGAYERFKSEINSTFTLQAVIEASIAIPQVPVSIDMHTELSRSVTSSQMSVGRKVMNRTIGFRTDFDDVPKLMKQYMSESSDADTEKDADIATESEGDGDDARFEVRLCDWILDRIKADDELEALKDEALATGCPDPSSRPLPADFVAARVFYHLKDNEEKRRKWYQAIKQAAASLWRLSTSRTM